MGNLEETNQPADKTAPNFTLNRLIRELPKTEQKKSNLTRLNELALESPGLVGAITRWIESTSLFPQPALSLAASISFVAALKAHRVQSNSGLRTNIYALGVAPASSGKGHALNQIEKIAKASGADLLLGGKPVSDSGLLKMLRDGFGRRLVLWDEFGLALSEMTGFKASPHKTAILMCLMDLFSASQITYRGKEYANHDGKMGRADIDQPCLSIYGTSTPTRFFEALKSSHAADGFVSRWLLFRSEQTERSKDESSIESGQVPEFIISEVQKILNMPTNVSPKGNLDTSIKPAVLKFDPLFKRTIKSIASDFDEMKNKSSNDLFRSLWGRAHEHFIKLCLVFEAGETISIGTISYAESLIKILVADMLEALESEVSDNLQEQQTKRVFKIIKSAKVISRSELIFRTRFLKTFERNDIVSQLIDSNQIEEFEDFRENSDTGEWSERRTKFYTVKCSKK